MLPVAAVRLDELQRPGTCLLQRPRATSTAQHAGAGNVMPPRCRLRCLAFSHASSSAQATSAAQGRAPAQLPSPPHSLLHACARTHKYIHAHARAHTGNSNRTHTRTHTRTRTRAAPLAYSRSVFWKRSRNGGRGVGFTWVRLHGDRTHLRLKNRSSFPGLRAGTVVHSKHKSRASCSHSHARSTSVIMIKLKTVHSCGSSFLRVRDAYCVASSLPEANRRRPAGKGPHRR